MGSTEETGQVGGAVEKGAEAMGDRDGFDEVSNTEQWSQ